MKQRISTTAELNKVVTSFTIYKFVKDMVTPYSELKIFDQGLIDKDGNYLVNAKRITPYYRLILNLRKLLKKIPDPTIKAKLKYLTTAVVLFVEETEEYGADPDIVFDEICNFLTEQGFDIDSHLNLLYEEAIVANSVSAGGIYGARGNPDETIVNQMAHLKRMKSLKKKVKKKFYLKIGTSQDPY